MKTILVATDFSRVANNATKYAVDMALAINASIHILHVYQVPVNYGEVPIAMNVDDFAEECNSEVEELKKRLTNETMGKVPIETEVRMGISFFEQLKEVCDTIRPYTVVMGSQGTSAAERFFLGAHTINAMKNLHYPLITVPPGVTFGSIRQIALACDFDKITDTVPIDEIRLLVNDFNAKLHILHVRKKEEFRRTVVFESALLQEMLAALKPEYHFLVNEDIDEGIMNFAQKNNIDLLIVLPKRHSLPASLLHKSHSKQLILHSHVPVMELHN